MAIRLIFDGIRHDSTGRLPSSPTIFSLTDYNKVSRVSPEYPGYDHSPITSKILRGKIKTPAPNDYAEKTAYTHGTKADAFAVPPFYAIQAYAFPDNGGTPS